MTIPIPEESRIDLCHVGLWCNAWNSDRQETHIRALCSNCGKDLIKAVYLTRLEEHNHTALSLVGLQERKVQEALEEIRKEHICDRS